MSANTKIEWADHTFNPWIGCTQVGPGCDNCYAKADFDDRRHRVVWGAGQQRIRTKTWGDPVKWNKAPFCECTACGWRGEEADRCFDAASDISKVTPFCPECTGRDFKAARARVFCASLADVFDNEVPTEWREDLWRLIEATPNLDWLLLTKRIGNVGNMLPVPFDFDRHYPNVWIGATIVNQGEADRDIPKLLAVPAAKRFLSMEPLLGPVDLWLQCENWSDDIVMDPETGAYECCRACDFTGIGNDIDWVIVGGESGPKARPMHPDWARSLRDQCQAAGVPFLFKQWGEFLPANANEADPSVADVPDSRLFWSDGDKWDRFDGQRAGVDLVARVGKKAAGRLLDGRTWDEVPA